MSYWKDKPRESMSLVEETEGRKRIINDKYIQNKGNKEIQNVPGEETLNFIH